MISNKNIDWEGNCIFENGKVIGFKRDSAKNNYHMLPVPCDTRTLHDAKEASLLLDATMQPMGKMPFAMMIKRLNLHCGKQIKTPEEVELMMIDYYNDLKSYPAQLLEFACQDYRKLPEGNNFMPSSGQLISLMAEKMAKLNFMRKRIDKILGKIEPEKENRGLSLVEALEKIMA